LPDRRHGWDDGSSATAPLQGTANLDQGRLRGSYRVNVDPAALDLGNEPPLSADGTSSAGIDRRRVSVQWFSGTILTGL
jgi:hypothetical protein